MKRKRKDRKEEHSGLQEQHMQRYGRMKDLCAEHQEIVCGMKFEKEGKGISF